MCFQVIVGCIQEVFYCSIEKMKADWIQQLQQNEFNNKDD